MKRLCTRATAAVILIAAAFNLSGCIIIPTPWEKEKFTAEDVSHVTPRLSTKDDVVQKFGLPDIIWETERVYVYRWERIRAVLFVGGGGTQGAFGTLSTDEAVLVLFDETDHVVRIEKLAKPQLGESYGDFLRHWLNQKPK
jgi:hypothetical protein